MSERTYKGNAASSKDGFEATISDSFYMFQIAHGGDYGREIKIDLNEAENMARWILKIHPYGNKVTWANSKSR